MEEKLYCFGCGSRLQDEDETKDGYIDPRALHRKGDILCKRCFQLKHYGTFKASSLVRNTIDLLQQSALKDDLIVLVVDCALVYAPLIPILKKLNDYKHIVMVANRYDLYETYLSEEKTVAFLKNQIQRNKLNISQVFLCHNNIEWIFEQLSLLSKDKNIYLVGLENAGKTTFINEILKSVQKNENSLLTNSKYPGTTVDLIKIPLDEKTFFIDSPGLYSNGNLLHILRKEEIQTLGADRKIKEETYQLRGKQSILIANVGRIDFDFDVKTGVSFYTPDSIEITRCKQEKASLTFKNQIPYLKWKAEAIKQCPDLVQKIIIIDDDYYHDIVIEGLGFIRLKKGKYIIYLPKNVACYVRKALI